MTENYLQHLTLKEFIKKTLESFEKVEVREIDFDIGISKHLPEDNKIYVTENSLNRIRFTVRRRK